jgi:hypothetical protein
MFVMSKFIRHSTCYDRSLKYLAYFYQISPIVVPVSGISMPASIFKQIYTHKKSHYSSIAFILKVLHMCEVDTYDLEMFLVTAPARKYCHLAQPLVCPPCWSLQR